MQRGLEAYHAMCQAGELLATGIGHGPTIKYICIYI